MAESVTAAPPRERALEQPKPEVAADASAPMDRMHKLVNVLGISLPLLGLIAAIVLLWDRGVGLAALAILAVGYVLTGIGVTVGYHACSPTAPSRRIPPSATRSPSSARWGSRVTS
jgi:stearoyl-CoA desaturase (delta-9 desaturase)